MTPARQRYFVRSRDGAVIAGFELREAEEFVALEYGDGASMVDTLAQAYYPMAQAVEDKALLRLGFDWLKHILFNDATIALRDSVLQAAIAGARADVGAG